MQTILGAGGVIARELAKNLPQYTNHLRLVSRHPKKVNATDELFPADLTDAGQTLAAVAGSEVVYLVVGLAYQLKVWQDAWPRVMQNVIAACEVHGAKLVFFDNVYPYGAATAHMTEATPFNPCAEKGEVRAQIALQLLDAMASGRIQALIARSADFYGPDTPASMLNFMVFDNLTKGKAPQWMMRTDLVHSFTYTPDAGKFTALLGNTPTAYGESWHLPSCEARWTPADFIGEIQKKYNSDKKVMVLGKGMMRFLSLFIPVLRETMEMQYQNSQPYFFDSSKFEKTFKQQATPYTEGLAATIAFYQQK